MPNYIVKEGDTLSKIASQQGVSASQITGYKSGNPNLIYPGEQLVIPTVQPAQVQPQPQVDASGLTGGVGVDTNVFKPADTTQIGSQYTPLIEGLFAKQKELISTPTEQTPGVMDLANQYGYTANDSAIKALQPEITALNQQLTDLNNQEQRAIAQYINADVTSGYQEGRTARIKRQYAVEKSAVSANLGVKLATAEMLQGNMDRARSIAKDIVDDLNYKNTQKRKDIETLYNYYGDVINSLSAKEKSELDNARADIIREEEYAREDYTNKVSAIMNAANNQLDVSAISGSDISSKSYEDIIVMISNAAQKKLAQEQAFEIAKLGVTDTTANNISEDTLNAVMLNPQLYYTLPIHTREAVATALQSRGYDITQLQSPAFVGKSKAAIASFNSAVAMTDTLEKLWGATTPAASWTTALLQAPGKLIGGAVGKDEAVKLYENQKKAFLTMISRALGEKGVLTDLDLARVERALPKIGDNASIAQKDFATLTQILEDIKQGATSTYGGTTNTTTTIPGVSDEQVNSFLNEIGF